jgi:pyruvate/2-oxoglutarate dehydrogenase complex dihydrolipoamide dehydrogenase (E3) component
MHFDLLVIGGGSAGYAAARTAHDLGARVGVVEGGPRIGGLCILRGCMPTKALIESSQRLHDIRNAAKFGIVAPRARPDPRAILRRKNRLVAGFARYRRQQLQSGRFTFLRGRARFIDAHTVEIDRPRGRKPQRVTLKHAVIATGSVVNDIRLPGLDACGFLTSDTALDLARVPRRLAVLGGGVIALEFAQHFARLGSEVTLIQRSPRVLREFDDDVSRCIEKAFRAEGIAVHTGTTLERIETRGRARIVHYRKGRKRVQLAVDDILHALGRRPAIDGLDLGRAGVVTEGGRIVVDPAMRTSVPHIYAAGDVTGLHEVVHIAIQQAETAARNAVGSGPAVAWDSRLACTVVFTDPNIAHAGASEMSLQAAGRPYLTASYPFWDHGKSMIHGAKHGFVKLSCDPVSGELLGATIVGLHGGELLHEMLAVLHFRGTVRDIATMPHYHPTLAEILTYPAEELAARLKA